MQYPYTKILFFCVEVLVPLSKITHTRIIYGAWCIIMRFITTTEINNAFQQHTGSFKTLPSYTQQDHRVHTIFCRQLSCLASLQPGILAKN